MSFKIRLVKPITVKDQDGKILEEYPIGHVLEATFDAGHYWVSSPSVYKDEAVVLEEEIDEQYMQLN